MIKMDKAVRIVNDKDPNGTKRALLIGINYTGQNGELTGCHNDVQNISGYLRKVHGFHSKDIVVLMDDQHLPNRNRTHYPPTRKNILEGFKNLVRVSKPGDSVFIHFSGHGGRVIDLNGDEDDGYDETLIPVDYKRAGHIVDDEIYDILVRPMSKGVLVTALIDCCHSGEYYFIQLYLYFGCW